MIPFITKNDRSFPIGQSGTATLSASDIHDRKPSARILALYAKKSFEGAQRLREESKKRREQKLLKLRMRIDGIAGSNQSPNAKIESLHRLLTNHYKEMDDSMRERIKRELAELNKSIPENMDNAKRLQQESQQNRSGKLDVKFIEPFVANPKTIVGHDPQTHENIFDDGTRESDELGDDIKIIDMNKKGDDKIQHVGYIDAQQIINDARKSGYQVKKTGNTVMIDERIEGIDNNDDSEDRNMSNEVRLATETIRSQVS